MNVLFVVPSEVSSGEAITALHVAECIAAEGVRVHFLSSDFTARFLEGPFRRGITRFTADRNFNSRIWLELLRDFEPDLILFADYPLLFFSSGAPPFADEAWASSLEGLDIPLVTFDHLGYAQKPVSLYFGPPHLSFHCETMHEAPANMQILLPCPVQEPGFVPGRRGIPFRYWDLPLNLPEAKRREVRRRYLRDEQELLIFHSTPGWAWQLAQSLGLPYYACLSKILQYYFSGLDRPVTILSINNGDLLAPAEHPGIRIQNLASLPKDEYEALMLASDLMITENRLSVSLGKAVCGLVPSVVLRNSYRLKALLADREEPLRRILLEMEGERLGAVFPYEVFPIFSRQEMELLGLYKHNSLEEAFVTLEVYDGEATRSHLHRLLLEPEAREALRIKQQDYVNKLQSLEDAYDTLRGVLEKQLVG